MSLPAPLLASIFYAFHCCCPMLLWHTLQLFSLALFQSSWLHSTPFSPQLPLLLVRAKDVFQAPAGSQMLKCTHLRPSVPFLSPTPTNPAPFLCSYDALSYNLIARFVALFDLFCSGLIVHDRAYIAPNSAAILWASARNSSRSSTGSTRPSSEGPGRL